MVRIVALDLDGTLLSSKKEISSTDKSSLLRLKQNKIHIVLVSGRHYKEMQNYAKEIGLTAGDYIISCDGQYIYDFAGELLWESDYIKKKDILWIKKHIADTFEFITDTNDYHVVNKKSIKRIIKDAKRSEIKKRSIHLIEILLYRLKKIEKVVISTTNDFIGLDKLFTVHRFDNGRIEIQHENTSKYNAIKRLCEMYFDGAIDELLYVGDDYNDKECFENIKNCVAMGTAPQEIKRKAIFVTKSCDEAGVAFALEKFFEQ